MAMRAVLLTDDAADMHATLASALGQDFAPAELRGEAARPARRAWWLATFRPHLVVAPAHGPDALLAALYRSLFPRTRLLVRARPTPEGGCAIQRRVRRGLGALVLRRADAILADDGAPPPAPRRGKAPARAARVFPALRLEGLDRFGACPLVRAPGAIHRMIYVGPLSAESGAADIQACAIAWAARFDDHPVEIWWAGDGDLAGVLDAQPLPAAMTQRFLGPQDRDGLASCFAQCGILLLPLEPPPQPAPVAEALLAGLVVVGSARDPAMQRFVQDGITGWSFDPERLDQVWAAIARSLGAVSDDLAAMRAVGREHVHRMAAQTDTDRLHAALSAIMPAVAPAAARRPSLAGLAAGPRGFGAGMTDPR